MPARPAADPQSPPPAPGRLHRMGIALLRRIIVAPRDLLVYVRMHPREAMTRGAAEIILRHFVIPAVLGALRPSLLRALETNRTLAAVGSLLDKIEIAFVVISAVVIWSVVRHRRRLVAGQRSVYDKLVRDPSQGELAVLEFAARGTTRPSHENMATIFSTLAQQMRLSYTQDQILRGAPTFSFELIRSAHVADGRTRWYMWAPKSLNPNPLVLFKDVCKAALRDVGLVYVRHLDEESRDLKRTHIRDILGLTVDGLSRTERKRTHVVLQRLTVHPSWNGLPLSLPDPKTEKDYMFALDSFMRVSPTSEQYADTVGVQCVVRPVTRQPLHPFASAVLQPGVTAPKGMPPSQFESLKGLARNKDGAASYQMVLNVFATVRGPDAAPARDAVERIVNILTQQYEFASFPDPSSLTVPALAGAPRPAPAVPMAAPVFGAPLTRLDFAPIVVNLGELTRAELIDRAQRSLSQTKIADLGTGHRLPIRIALRIGRVFGMALAYAVDRVRIRLASGPLAPLFSRAARYYQEDPIQDFDLPGPEALAPVRPRGEFTLEELVDEALGREDDRDDAGPAAAPEAEDDAAADGLTAKEERSLPPEAAEVYRTLVARAYPIQEVPAFVPPAQQTPTPALGVVASHELPLFFHLPRDAESKLAFTVKTVPPAFQSRWKYDDEERDHIIFGEGVNDAQEKVYIRVPKMTLRRHCRITSPSGTGKSELVRSLAFQYIRHGHGALIIDPTQKLLDQLVRDVSAHCPERLPDLLYWDLEDDSRPIGMNLMQRPRKIRGTDLVARDIADVIEGVSAPGGGSAATSKYFHQYVPLIIQALWAQGYENIWDLYRFVANEEFRAEVVERAARSHQLTLRDLTDVGTAGKIEEKLDPAKLRIMSIVQNEHLSRFFGQPRTTIDLAEVMRKRQVLFVRLQNEQDKLVGRVLISELYQAMWQRPMEDYSPGSDFPVFIDEFNEYANRMRQLTDMIQQARKYGIVLYLTQQFEGQLNAGSDTQRMQESMAQIPNRWTFVLPRKAAVAFAAAANDLVTANDLQALPGRRTGYLITTTPEAGAVAMTATTLDTGDIGVNRSLTGDEPVQFAEKLSAEDKSLLDDINARDAIQERLAQQTAGDAPDDVLEALSDE